MELKGKIVFSSGKQGDYDIWKLDLGTKELTQLTEGTYWNDAPKFSPDGKKIIFISNRSGVGEIWLMNEDGSDQRQITDAKRIHFAPAWHPNGESIVFCTNYKNNLDIFTMNIDGSGVAQITDYSGVDSTPRFSPDGTKIIFTSQRSGNDDIWEYDLETAAFKQLTTHPAQDFSPVYSPDAEAIAFVSGRYKAEGEINLDIFMMDKDGSNERRVTNNKGADRFVSWSPDGKFIIYTASSLITSAERLMVMDIEKMKSKALDFDRRPLEGEVDAEPKGFGLFSFLPDIINRQFYSRDYFGTERFPDWAV